MMQPSIEHGADGGHIAEQLAPVFHRAVRSQQRAESFVAVHYDFQQIFGSGVRQFAHAEGIEDQRRNGAVPLYPSETPFRILSGKVARQVKCATVLIPAPLNSPNSGVISIPL